MSTPFHPSGRYFPIQILFSPSCSLRLSVRFVPSIFASRLSFQLFLYYFIPPTLSFHMQAFSSASIRFRNLGFVLTQTQVPPSFNIPSFAISPFLHTLNSFSRHLLRNLLLHLLQHAHLYFSFSLRIPCLFLLYN